jgi:glycosyltransferase involved in cell wall biosynthesis
VRRAFHLEPDRVRVFAPELPTFPERDANLVRELRDPALPTVLYVGSTVGYKNVDRLLAAFRELRRSSKARLLLVTPEPFAISDEGARCLGALDRGGLRAAYEASDLVVMPSLVETVGLPLLEAMCLNVPVAAADRPYAREICGDAALYFDPLDASAMADAMRRGLTDAGLRERLRSSGRFRVNAQVANDYAALVNTSMMVARAARAD